MEEHASRLLGMDLGRFIMEEERKFPEASGSLSLALMAIRTATKLIAAQVRRAGLTDILGQMGTTNVQGENVQKLDALADAILIQRLSASGQFYAIASEENDSVIFPEEGKNGGYIIAFDPLDGSSNIDVNISVGTIFSIYRKLTGTKQDFFQPGRNIVAAGYVIYGSSTILVYSTGSGVHGFTLDPTIGTYLLSHEDIRIPEKGKIYAFNESNYDRWEPGIQKYVNELKGSGYTGRWVGSMVADVHRTLIKGGIFSYPANSKSPNGHLRLLYEAIPMGYLIVQAGGMATAGHEALLDVTVQDIHQRTPVFLGGKSEMTLLESFIK